MGHIIAVINQKGGVGKTTVAIQLAGAMTRAGLSTLLVDADPQSTATRWIQAAPEDAPSQIKAVSLASARGKLHQEVRKFVGDFDAVLVDCPPNSESLAWQSVLTIADLALIPVRPDPGDLLSTMEFVQTATRVAETSNPELQMRFVASNIRNGTALAKTLRASLEEHLPDVPLLKTQLSQRTAFPNSFSHGDSVHAMGKVGEAAAAEVDALTIEVVEVLNSLGVEQ